MTNTVNPVLSQHEALNLKQAIDLLAVTSADSFLASSHNPSYVIAHLQMIIDALQAAKQRESQLIAAMIKSQKESNNG